MISFIFNDTATTEIYTLSYTTLFRSHGVGLRAVWAERADSNSRRSGGGVEGLGGLSVPSIRAFMDAMALSENPARWGSTIGRAHVCTPVTVKSRMPSSACTNRLDIDH